MKSSKVKKISSAPRYEIIINRKIESNVSDTPLDKSASDSNYDSNSQYRNRTRDGSTSPNPPVVPIQQIHRSIENKLDISQNRSVGNGQNYHQDQSQNYNQSQDKSQDQSQNHQGNAKKYVPPALRNNNNTQNDQTTGDRNKQHDNWRSRR